MSRWLKNDYQNEVKHVPDDKQSSVLATPPDRMREAEAGPGSRAEGLKEEEPAPFHNGALARGTPDGAFNVGRRAPSRITPQH